MKHGANKETKLLALVVFMILELLKDTNGVKQGKIREWLRERAEKGMFQMVLQLSLQDTWAFKEMMRMNPEQFAEILKCH